MAPKGGLQPYKFTRLGALLQVVSLAYVQDRCVGATCVGATYVGATYVCPITWVA